MCSHEFQATVDLLIIKREMLMFQKILTSSAVAVTCTLAVTCNAQIVVNDILGPLAITSSTNLSDDTTGANQNVDLYPSTSPFDETLGEIVYEFSIIGTAVLGITNNEGILVGTDHDHYLLDGLGTTFDGVLNLADSDIGFVDEDGLLGIYPAGTYYLSVDTYNDGVNVEGPFDIDLTVDAPNSAPPSTFLGTTGNDVDANTIGSGFDTELAIYDVLGNLLGTNDDIAGNVLQSQVVATLPNGIYYAAVGGWDSVFTPNFGAAGGEESGSYVISVNALSTAGELGTGEVAWFSFDVVPEPSSLMLLSLPLLGLIGTARRR